MHRMRQVVIVLLDGQEASWNSKTEKKTWLQPKPFALLPLHAGLKDHADLQDSFSWLRATVNHRYIPNSHIQKSSSDPVRKLEEADVVKSGLFYLFIQ